MDALCSIPEFYAATGVRIAANRSRRRNTAPDDPRQLVGEGDDCNVAVGDAFRWPSQIRHAIRSLPRAARPSSFRLGPPRRSAIYTSSF
jgi:hypothetical protein